MKIIILLAFLASSSLSMASTEDICKDVGTKVASQNEVIQTCATFIAERVAVVLVDVNKFYDGLKAKYEECMANNGRCNAYKIRITSKDESGNVVVKYQEIDLTRWEELKKRAEEGIQRAAEMGNQQCLAAVSQKGVEECKDQFHGFQDTTNMLVNLSTFFMSSILPDSVTHVDIGDVLSGKPLGGRGAIVVEIREALFNATGTPDFIRNYYRDPINVSQNVVKELLKGAGSILNNLCGDICRGAHVRF